MVLQTERLILRQMVQNDFGDLADMLKNPNVMYAYGHCFTSQDVQTWLNRQLKRYQEDGFGLWAVVLKSSKTMIGQAGLTLQPFQQTRILEIGYLLKEAFWHYGYATEAALGCKKYAFEALGQSKVYSIIKVDNTPSIKVAKRLGMTLEDTFYAQYYNGPQLHALYSATRPA